MTTDDQTPPGDAPTPARRRAVIVGSVVGGVVVLGIIAALVVAVASSGPDGASPSASPTAAASASSSAAPSTTPSPSASTSTSPSPSAAAPDERFGTPVATEVAKDEPATVAGATITLDSITTETVSGQRAGETAGPAVRVVVRLANPADGETLDLSTVAVRAYTGSDLTPASPVDEGTGFTGSLAAGDSTTATYLFSIPEGAQDSVTITVGLTADSGLAVFTP